ncbi:hypothetical protein RBB50_005575 [Rhinocladiella similis]
MAANFFPTNNSALVEQPISRSWQDITSEVYAGTPCLVVPFGSSKIKLKETFSGEHAVLHQYPRLLTLGTLLVDLGRQRPPNQPGWGDFEQRINNDFVIGNGVWEDSGGPYFYPQRMFEFRPKMARKIIKAAVRDSEVGLKDVGKDGHPKKHERVGIASQIHDRTSFLDNVARMPLALTAMARKYKSLQQNEPHKIFIADFESLPVTKKGMPCCPLEITIRLHHRCGRHDKS